VLSTTLVANGIDGHLCRTALQRIHWTTSTPRGMSISALKPFMAGIAIKERTCVLAKCEWSVVLDADPVDLKTSLRLQNRGDGAPCHTKDIGPCWRSCSRGFV
jgi:hypothetical protein